jgi:hypothetical protein
VTIAAYRGTEIAAPRSSASGGGAAHPSRRGGSSPAACRDPARRSPWWPEAVRGRDSGAADLTMPCPAKPSHAAFAGYLCAVFRRDFLGCWRAMGSPLMETEGTRMARAKTTPAPVDPKVELAQEGLPRLYGCGGFPKGTLATSRAPCETPRRTQAAGRRGGGPRVTRENRKTPGRPSVPLPGLPVLRGALRSLRENAGRIANLDRHPKDADWLPPCVREGTDKP